MLYVEFSTQDTDTLLALLSAFPFEGFQEFEDGLHGYIGNADWNTFQSEILNVISGFASYQGAHMIPDKNWNAAWEASFTPVIIDDFCAIRASFHELIKTCNHEIIIDPKMAFGTGHHETTELMIRQMREMSFYGKTVLDLGCGTGVLAILAAKCNAKHVTAIDNDPEAVNNARENAGINRVEIGSTYGTVDDLATEAFDIVLANINRNTLVDIMPAMKRVLHPDGTLLLSGILVQDRIVIEEAAHQMGLRLIREESLGEWLSLKYLH